MSKKILLIIPLFLLSFIHFNLFSAGSGFLCLYNTLGGGSHNLGSKICKQFKNIMNEKDCPNFFSYSMNTSEAATAHTRFFPDSLTTRIKSDMDLKRVYKVKYIFIIMEGTTYQGEDFGLDDNHLEIRMVLDNLAKINYWNEEVILWLVPIPKKSNPEMQKVIAKEFQYWQKKPHPNSDSISQEIVIHVENNIDQYANLKVFDEFTNYNLTKETIESDDKSGFLNKLVSTAKKVSRFFQVRSSIENLSIDSLCPQKKVKKNEKN